ncbi:MAG: extracellular solute-binding protein [Anaerolineae bacterium]|nr:extracellular solute-binding protein [Anaerolineae bacterium]
MKNKLFALLSLLVLVSIVLSGCGGPAATEEPAPVATEEEVEPVATEEPTEEATEEATEEPTEEPAAEATVITVWHGWDGAYLEEYEKITEEFNASRDDIKIELAKVDDLSDALAVAIPAGEGPDIMQWVQDQVGRNALVGNIVAIDEWVDQAYLDDTYEPAAAKAMVWNDQVWGIPESQEGIALVYNKDLVTEENLPNPEDFDDLLAKAAAFREENPDMYYLCNQGLGNPDAYHVAPVYFGNGMSKFGGYIDDQGSVFMNTPEGYAAAEWMNEFREVAPAETSHEICQAMLTEGQAAMWWTGPWAIADLEAAGFNYGIAPMGSPFVGIKLFMLTPNAVDRGNAEAAIEVMKFFGSAEVQKRLSLVNKTIPANSEALNDAEVQALYTVAMFGESLNRGTPMPNHPYIDCQWGPVGDATTSLWNGSQGPTEAMDDAQTAIETCVAEMQ